VLKAVFSSPGLWHAFYFSFYVSDKTRIMKLDMELEKEVNDELRWDERLKGCKIVAQIRNGIAFLRGTANRYSLKTNATAAVLRIPGVRGVENLIDVEVQEQVNDKDLEKTVTNAVVWNSTIDKNRIRVKVQNGWVTLEGDAEFEYQKTKARNLALDIAGVKGVDDRIEVLETTNDTAETGSRIRAAMRRKLSALADSIKVRVANGCAVLSGRVHNDLERNAAEDAARSVPGVQRVNNRLMVE
jgi:osmotically-inducible protein OsmY